jgi:PAS domain-containing protein
MIDVALAGEPQGTPGTGLGTEFGLLFEASLNGVIATDQEGVITAWNLAAEQILGWTSAEARGRQLAAVIVPPRLRGGRYGMSLSGAGQRRAGQQRRADQLAAQHGLLSLPRPQGPMARASSAIALAMGAHAAAPVPAQSQEKRQGRKIFGLG